MTPIALQRDPGSSTAPRPETPNPKAQSGAVRQRVPIDHLSGAEKSAIIVRAVLAQGADIALTDLPHHMQAELAQTLGRMRLVDRATMNAVVEDFLDTLDQIGLSFPENLEAALSMLGDKLDASATRRLRAISRGGNLDDAWMVLELADDALILSMLTRESQGVGAILLSKLSTDKAARLLMQLDADLARDLALGIARTEDIAPAAVAQIGKTLAEEITTRPQRAFPDPPTKRIGNILNSSDPDMREGLLAQLEISDAQFARDVRKAIFTFQDIAARLDPRDVPLVIRDVDMADLMTLIAANKEADLPSLRLLLDNMSKRLVAGLQDDAAAQPPPSDAATAAASSRIAGFVRALVDAEKIQLLPPPED